MTDEELLKAGERLYNSFVQSPFSFLELAGLAAARERRMPWSQLGPRLKFAVLRLVVGPEPEGSATTSSDAPTVSAAPAASAAPVATTPSAPSANPAPATTASQDPTPSSTVEAAPTVASGNGAPTAASTADTTQPSVSPDPADSGKEVDDNGDDRV